MPPCRWKSRCDADSRKARSGFPRRHRRYIVLTILGYSINDTIVIYDRIRENTQLHRSMPVAERVNLSINQSFVRTMNTTITTVMAMSVV